MDQNIFGQKKIWVKKILGKKNIGSKNFGMKKMLDPKKFCLKKQVGLTQGGGYMPPPPKMVGLKLCWIVVSLAW